MVVGLEFKSEDHARKALAFLPGFAPLAGHPSTLWRLAYGRESHEPELARSEVDDVKELLEKFRVYHPHDRHEPIDSCNTSIDFGPQFHLDFSDAIRAKEIADRQLNLF